MKSWVVLGLSLAALATSGCEFSQKTENKTQVVKVTAEDQWPAFRDAYIKRAFELDPASAVYEGAHQFDGQLPDWSAMGLKAQADFYRGAIDKAAAVPDAGMTDQDKFERQYLIASAKGKLFWLEDADFPHHNPAYYVGGGLDPNVYLARPYADLPTRMRAMIKFFNAVPAAAANIRANLQTPMPASYVKFGIAGFDGFADFYANDAKQAFANVQDADLQQQFATASQAASASMRDLATWLKGQQATATQGFPLGAERFSRMLAATEMVDTPLDQLEAIGQADLKRNQDALKAACTQYAPGRTVEQCVAKEGADKPADPVAEATKQIPTLREFVTSHNIVTIPGTEEAQAHESPPYNRQNSAYIDPAGPLDKNVPSVYYISPPDPTWTPAMRAAYVPSHATLLFTTIHEVMPGHFVQFLHSNRSPIVFGRYNVGYAFAEGWAHYSEQMMWDEGVRANQPEYHIGQLTEALLRDCRYLSAIGMHARGMTQAQSEQMFLTQCYQDPGNAKQQAARGTYDPLYLAYTMGKLMILKLRTDWMAQQGGKGTLKAFHDQLLSYGGPPLPLVRQAMLKEPQPHAAF